MWAARLPFAALFAAFTTALFLFFLRSHMDKSVAGNWLLVSGDAFAVASNQSPATSNYFALGIASPLFTLMRSLVPSSSICRRARVGVPLFGSRSITFDAWMGAANSMIPLCSSGVRARRCRFAIFTPSTVMRPVFRYTRITLPSLPLSSPRITRTVSPLVTCSLRRSALSAWRLRLTAFGRSALRCLRILILDDLGRQRHDLHVPLLAQLARDR